MTSVSFLCFPLCLALPASSCFTGSPGTEVSSWLRPSSCGSAARPHRRVLGNGLKPLKAKIDLLSGVAIGGLDQKHEVLHVNPIVLVHVTGKHEVCMQTLHKCRVQKLMVYIYIYRYLVLPRSKHSNWFRPRHGRPE